jgi:hypothetical protein
MCTKMKMYNEYILLIKKTTDTNKLEIEEQNKNKVLKNSVVPR